MRKFSKSWKKIVEKFFDQKFSSKKNVFFKLFIFLNVLNYGCPVSEYELLTPKTKKITTDSLKKYYFFPNLSKIHRDLRPTWWHVLTCLWKCVLDRRMVSLPKTNFQVGEDLSVPLSEDLKHSMIRIPWSLFCSLGEFVAQSYSKHRTH